MYLNEIRPRVASKLWLPGKGGAPQKYGYRPKGVTVTRASIREYLATQRARYRVVPRAERSRLLDEIVAVTGSHRKAVIRRLRDTPRG